MDWHEAIRQYVTAMKGFGYRAATVTLYRHYLLQLAGCFPNISPWEVSERRLEQVLGNFQWGPSARKSMRTAVVGFYRWGFNRGDIEIDPAQNLRVVKVPAGQPRPAPERVVLEALLRADDRVRLMLELGIFLGLRAGEMSRVHSDDLFEIYHGRYLLRVHGKGGKIRDIPVVDGNLLEAIEAANGWLFPNYQRPGTHITPNHVSKLVSRALPPQWTAHNLRHRFGTQSYAGTRDLVAVSKLLGHASTDTTLIYVEVPSEALFETVAAAGTIETRKRPKNRLLATG